MFSAIYSVFGNIILSSTDPAYVYVMTATCVIVPIFWVALLDLAYKVFASFRRR